MGFEASTPNPTFRCPRSAAGLLVMRASQASRSAERLGFGVLEGAAVHAVAPAQRPAAGRPPFAAAAAEGQPGAGQAGVDRPGTAGASGRQHVSLSAGPGRSRASACIFAPPVVQSKGDLTNGPGQRPTNGRPDALELLDRLAGGP